jgi:hypothetical protein
VRNATLRAPLVLLATYALLTLAAFWISEGYVTAWLPLLKLESQWLLPRGLLCESVALVTRNTQRLVELHAITAVQLDHDVLPPGVGLKSTTLQAYVLSHPVIVYAILAAWPVADWRGRATLLMLGAPCVLVTTSLDIPFVLAGHARSLILEQFAPGRADSDPLVLYYSFMHGGGRLGLAISGALLTALVATHLRSRKASRAPSSTTTGRDVNYLAQKRHRVAAPAR